MPKPQAVSEDRIERAHIISHKGESSFNQESHRKEPNSFGI